MEPMIPQMVAICNDYFLNTIPFFPLNSTHTKFALGQNRVTERKEALLPESDLTFRKFEKERTFMSSKNNNQLNIPQAREAMDKFKMQAASEVGVNLTNGYNGHLTSREAGSVGGQMVKKMIEAYEQGLQ